MIVKDLHRISGKSFTKGKSFVIKYRAPGFLMGRIMKCPEFRAAVFAAEIPDPEIRTGDPALAGRVQGSRHGIPCDLRRVSLYFLFGMNFPI
jgi:hypothetical protein